MSPYPAYLNDGPLTLEPLLSKRNRVRLTVEVDLDPIPGACSTPEWWCDHLQWHLMNVAAWYYPAVTIAETPAGAESTPVPQATDAGVAEPAAAPAPLNRHDRYQQLSTYRKPRLAGMVSKTGYEGDLGRWSKHDLITTILETEGYPLAWDSHPAVKP